jgi:hypothetical protein
VKRTDSRNRSTEVEKHLFSRLSVRTTSSTHPVDVAILKDRFGEASLGDIQHGATYAFSRCHVVREKRLPQWIEGSECGDQRLQERH